MQAPNAMETMARIPKSASFVCGCGLGVALANGLAGLTRHHKVAPHFRQAWPGLLIILGVLLTRYTE